MHDNNSFLLFYYFIKNVSATIDKTNHPNYQIALELLNKFVSMMPNGINHLDDFNRNILHQSFENIWVPSDWILNSMVNDFGLNINHQDMYGRTLSHFYAHRGANSNNAQESDDEGLAHKSY